MIAPFLAQMMSLVSRKVLWNCLPSQSVVVSSSAYGGPQEELGSSLPTREDRDDTRMMKYPANPAVDL